MNGTPIRIAVVTALLLGAVFCAAGCTYVETAPTEDAYEPPEPEPPEYYAGGEFGEITPYGHWIHTAPFGWVWQPDVDSDDWQPYFHGQWVWSEWGWTWVSYEPYGWAVYHYGSWVFDNIFGWIWTPGYEWYPSRVEWVVYDDYVCWAPIPPSGYEIGDPWSSPVDVWIVVDPVYFARPNVARYARRRFHPDRPRHKRRDHVRRTSPDRHEISRRGGHPVRKIDIEITRVKKGEKTLKKIKLPPEERKIIRRYEEETRKKIRKRPAHRERVKPSADRPGRKRPEKKLKKSRGEKEKSGKADEKRPGSKERKHRKKKKKERD